LALASAQIRPATPIKMMIRRYFPLNMIRFPPLSRYPRFVVRRAERLKAIADSILIPKNSTNIIFVANNPFNSTHSPQNPVEVFTNY
jgi:hypothetical protein